MDHIFTKRYIRGYRLHHGMSGLGIFLAGATFRNKTAMIVGLTLMFDDITDVPWHFSDEKLPWLYPRRFGVVRLFIR